MTLTLLLTSLFVAMATEDSEASVAVCGTLATGKDPCESGAHWKAPRMKKTQKSCQKEVLPQDDNGGKTKTQWKSPKKLNTAPQEKPLEASI